MTSLFDSASLESQVNLFNFALFLFVTDNIFYFVLYSISTLIFWLGFIQVFRGRASSNWTCENYSSVQDKCTLDVKQSYTQYVEGFTVRAFTICFVRARFAYTPDVTDWLQWLIHFSQCGTKPVTQM